MFSTKTHVHGLHGWTGHIKLQYMIFFLHYIAYCLGMVPCVSFVSLSALLYDLLEQSSGCIYVAQNNGHAPSIQYSR